MNLDKFGEEAQKLGVLGIKATQGGVLKAERLWDEECRRNVYSASKSFTSCAVGLADSEGYPGGLRAAGRAAERISGAGRAAGRGSLCLGVRRMVVRETEKAVPAAEEGGPSGKDGGVLFWFA